MGHVTHGVGQRVRLPLLSTFLQPGTDEETQLGAVNRARAAVALCREVHGVTPMYSVGMEGGVMQETLPAGVGWGSRGGDDTSEPHTALTCFAHMAVLHVSSGAWGWGRTGTFPLPPRVAALVSEGVELGHADDRVF